MAVKKNESIKQSVSPIEFKPNRRDVLKIAGATVVGLAARDVFGSTEESGTVIDIPHESPEPQLLAENFRIKKKDTLERFEAVGLENFYPFYESAKALEEVYGVIPSCSLEGIPMADILSKVAAGKTSQHHDGITLLQNSWGEKQGQMVEAAHDKLASLEIQYIDDVSPEYRDRMHQICVDMANVFPVLAITAPSVLEVNATMEGGGGYYDAYYGVDGKIAANAGGDIEDALVVLYHEQVHAFEDNWINALPYISKEAFAHLLVTQSEAVRKVFDTYFSLPWDRARDFKSGQPLWPTWLTPDPIIVDGLEKRFSRYANNEDQYDFMGQVEEWERYNRVLHAVGKKIMTVRAKSSEELSDAERKFMEEYDNPDGSESAFRDHISKCVGELYHYFVGPVQKEEGGFPDRIHPPGYNESMMTRLNIEIQSARLLVVSSISPEDCIDAPLDSVRNALLPANRLDSDDDFSQEIPPEYSISLTDIPFDPPVAVQEEPEEAPISPSGVDPWGA